jgi:dTDP-4-dehydrorhamnose 3,5-epimerase
MRFVETPVDGAFVIEFEANRDSRGEFSRTFCQEAFARAGVSMQVLQTNISKNLRKMTLRGLHYQGDPHGEPKIVHCVRGRVFDVAVDLRPRSPTYCKWTSMELSPGGGRALYIPSGCAHGFLTLEDDSDLFYLMGAPFVPDSQRGVRWNDSAFKIAWPGEPAEITQRDAGYPDFSPGAIISMGED